MKPILKLPLLVLIALFLLFPAVANAAQIHTVSAGETLTRISYWYQVPLERIAQANNITNPDRIYVGQTLVIPNVAEMLYTVQRGDTLWSIASHYGTTVEKIAVANGINPGSTIYVGQTLVIPQAGNVSEQINFPNNHTATRFQVSIPANSHKTYTLYAQAGQRMEVRVQSADPGIVVRNMATAQPFGRAGIDHTELVWREYLPQNGSYQVVIYNNSNSPQQTSVTISIPQRIQFAPGATLYNLTAPFTQPYQAYIFHAEAGQTITANLYAVRGGLYFHAADGTLIPNSGPNQIVAPHTGDYILQVITASGVELPEFTLTLYIRD